MSVEAAKQVLVDREWWRAFGKQFGWKLVAWSLRDYATYRGPNKERIEITRYMRDSIQGGMEIARGQIP